jgi:hypothetical protein
MALKNPRKPQAQKVAGYGPCMSILTPMQRSFVEVIFDHPELSRAHCCQRAGYKGDYEAVKKMGYRLMRNPLVLDGIRETAETTLRGKLPKTLHAIDNIISDPEHRGHQKTLIAVMDRTGMHAITETRSTITHTIDRADLLGKIALLMQKHNVPLLAPMTTDAVVLRDGDLIEVKPEDIE